MPRFSVVIPCYNAAQTIAETLTSVLDQTFFDFEVIIVDDGSTDETVAIAAWFAERSRRIRIVSQTNEGPSVARNRAVFDHAQGELIAFLDADDIMAPRPAGYSRPPVCKGQCADCRLWPRRLLFGERQRH